MQLEEFSFQYNGASIFGKHTQPEEVKGVVVVIHGMGGHSGRYLEHVVPMLLKCSLAVVLYDNIGHGKSEGKRGHCPSYDGLLNIITRVLIKAETLFPTKPLFLYGHSMGGNLVLNYALRKSPNIRGVIATSPYLRLAMVPPKWKMIMGKIMMTIWPAITLPSGLDPKGISSISNEVEKYINDPLTHDKVSPMYTFPVINAGEWAIEQANQLKIKTLLLHGTADSIIDYKGTVDFHDNASVTELKLFEGGYHELHYDLCRDEMLETVKNWLQQQL
ncbi:alpha-beta hydrolase superfamily lysophospholipase [Saonia flava]|uniref:Alpha-beta hydrolase superfamily lysophospholipase n=1 Tax=Saonia flava TaxID=523696 RepID=A0A846QWW5_9FLAO|nr:alpha/beta hydrolase [Saonia flava]NJB70095.1 alpha-beta hydrolase superfamily lysophospholipase [Saonia flava]